VIQRGRAWERFALKRRRERTNRLLGILQPGHLSPKQVGTETVNAAVIRSPAARDADLHLHDHCAGIRDN